MGLCKCPKRRVTNQFCFEHRVCVCEHCMVSNHPICVVQSYLKWLQDSDFNSTCELCSKELNVEDSIRLTCYHVFHWSCLDHLSRQLPPTTAPRGYACPSCESPLFPAPNLISPVADVLKEKLAGVNWARAGLGLPLLAEEREVRAPAAPPKAPSAPPHAVVQVAEETGAFIRAGADAHHTSSRRAREPKPLFDHDDDKYKRRPASELVRNWWRITFGSSKVRSGRSAYRKWCMLGIILVLAVVILVLIFSRLGKYATDNDPSFDILNNANVHVQHEAGSLD